MGDQRSGGADAFVVSGLLGNVGEHLCEMGVGVADPPGFGAVPVQQVLGHGQAKQFSLGQELAAATPLPGGHRWHDVVGDEHVECCQEGV